MLTKSFASQAMLKSDTSVETQDVPFSVVVDDVSVTLEEDLESMVSVVETVDKGKWASVKMDILNLNLH